MPKFPVEFLPIAQDHPVPQPETAALLSAPKNRPRHALSKAPDPSAPQTVRPPPKPSSKPIHPQTTRPPPKLPPEPSAHRQPDHRQRAPPEPIYPQTTRSPPKGPSEPPLSALPPAQYPKRPLPRRQNPPIPQSHDSAPEGHRHLKPHRPFFNHINRSAACKHPLPLLFCRTVR